MVMTNVLLDIPQRAPELGRIRLGEKNPRTGAPIGLKTFRLTSASRPLLDAAAKLYGGRVQPWAEAPDPGYYQLTTATAELDILIPTNLRSLSQSLELWQGGTLERRCDGTREQITDGPCLCAAAGQTGSDRDCELLTRLSVMLPRVPGLGVWRLDTSGWQAATTLPSTITLLASLATGQWAHAVLRAEQRSKRERLADGKVETHRFIVPVIDLPGMTVSQLVAGPEGINVATPALEPGERPAPPTARERVAIARRELEASDAIVGEDGPEQIIPAGVPALAPAGAGSATTPAAADGGVGSSPSTPPDPAERQQVVNVLTGEVLEGLPAGALREWLREHRIAIPYALEVARQTWGNRVETLDSLDDMQRAQLRADLEAQP
jgi:Recombination directionality factor-like